MVTQIVHKQVEIVQQQIREQSCPMAICFPSMTITQSLNTLAIIVNALVSLALLYTARLMAR